MDDYANGIIQEVNKIIEMLNELNDREMSDSFKRMMLEYQNIFAKKNGDDILKIDLKSLVVDICDEKHETV
jgi:hypothetical protein